MTKTLYFFLQDASQELLTELERNGPIQCSATPPIYLRRTPDFEAYKGNGVLTPSNIDGIRGVLKSALTYENDDSNFRQETHHLQVVATAIQLVKPTQMFCEYWIQTSENYGIQTAASKMRFVPNVLASPYLRYQYHHTITLGDVRRAIKIVPALAQALDQGHDSWTHPLGSIHRAAIFFAQGYATEITELPQLLWAAGLDCLFVSKRDKKLRGAPTISKRLQKLFGQSFNPYSAVTVPSNQQRPTLHLNKIGEHIFWLRNAYIHGLQIDDQWRSDQGQPWESGYAYQLLECTEILLRETLLKILEDQVLLATFLDPVKLDNYF